MNPGTSRQLFYRLLVGSLCFLALIAILAFLSGDFSDTDARLLGTTFSLALYTSTSLAGATVIRRRELVALVGFVDVVFSLVGCLSAIDLIWSESGFADDALARLAFSSLVLALAASQASLMLAHRQRGDHGAQASGAAQTSEPVAASEAGGRQAPPGPLS